MTLRNTTLDEYLNQPLHLEGIKLVHGTSDQVVPISQAQRMDRVLTERNVDHVYVEHGGAHIFIPKESLQSLSDNLASERIPSAVEQTTWGAIKLGQ